MVPLSILFSFPAKILVAVLLSGYVSRRGYRRKSLNFSGALAGLVTGFVMTLSNYCFCMCLLMFFFSSSAITKWRAENKKKFDSEYKEGGQRNWVQVVCNGGAPVFVSCLYLVETYTSERPVNFGKDAISSALTTSIIGALASSNGDTWASEIGTAVGSVPRLITTFKRVPVGTNGGITLTGTFASAVAGMIIGLTYWGGISVIMFLKGVTSYPTQWPIILVGLGGGLLGSICDSLLGATLQYSGFCSLRKKVVNFPYPTAKHISGRNVLDNNLVNLLTSCIMSIIMPGIAYKIWHNIG